MNSLPQPPTRKNAWARMMALAVSTLLAGCANGDFGEVNPTLVTDGIHDWIGRDAVAPKPPSVFEYTDDERALRDLAYPLIEPPYDRQKWYSVAGEYGLVRFTMEHRAKYYERLARNDVERLFEYNRSPSSRYARLIDDIRNDTTRLSQFFETAGRVIDIDQKRKKSLAYITDLNKAEWVNAKRRIRENAHVVKIVRYSLEDRVSAYRFALERLVISTPSTQAVEAERAINQLLHQIARYHTLPPTWAREQSLAAAN
jgi:hypothetical protein